MWPGLYRVLTSRWLLAVVVAAPLVAATLTANMSFDEAIWTHIGFGWAVEGAKPYLERFDSKPPGVMMVFGLADLAVGVNTWLVRLIGVLALVLASLVIYAIGRRAFDRTAGALAMVIYGLMMSRSVLDGPYAAHAESFMVLFSVLAFYLLARALRAVSSRTYALEFLLAWLAIGIATFCFKQVAMCTAIGLLAFYFLHRKSARTKTALPRDLAIAAAGMAASIFLTLLPLALSGVPAGEYWRAAWVSPFYAEEVNTSILGRVLGFCSTWQHGELLLFVPLLVAFLAQRRSLNAGGAPFAGIAAWLIADFVGANASGNYYGHQLRQVMPPLALASGLGLSAALQALGATAERAHKRSLAAVGLAVLLLIPYGMLLKAAFQRPLRDPARELGTWIRGNSTPTDSIFPCGPTSMQILAWSRRRTPCRYFNLIFAPLPGAEAELAKSIADSPPRYVLVPSEGLDALPPREHVVADWLPGMIAGSYTPKLVMNGYCVYERRHGPSSPAPGPARSAR